MNFSSKPRILDNFISVKDAAKYSGYSQQYLRRLLRRKKIIGSKVGQLWVIDIDTLEDYLELGVYSKDKRFGGKFE